MARISNSIPAEIKRESAVFLGMEGRGLYAGATVAGLHSEVSERDGDSWGMQERVFYGIGNNVGRARFEDNNDVVSSELWIPSLGRFGHFTFGEKYDVSSEGIRKKQLAEIMSILQNSSDPEDVAVVGRLDVLLKNNNEEIKTKDFLRIGRALRRNGFELVERLGDHSDGATKYTFRSAGSWDYGNIEFMSNVMQNKAYCSYNYGNNFFTHFFIDYLGWKGRGY